MRQSTEDVDQYIADLKAAAADSTFPVDPATNRPIFGAKTSDSASLGNKDFGVSYSYDIGWKLANLDGAAQRLCSTELDLNADFAITATVFGRTEALVTSNSFVKTEPVPNSNDKVISSHVSLYVVDQELFNVGQSAPVTVQTNGKRVDFPAFRKQLVKRRTLLEAKAHFAIGPVPVTISAGASGEVGVDLSLTGGMQFRCENPYENPYLTYPADTLTIDAKGNVRPYTALTAFATAAVDLVVASAGVRADLTLLELSVPFKLGVDVASSSVAANTDLKLVLETLKGRISVFIDTLFGKVVDETIFTWDGPRVEQTIVNETWNMDLLRARTLVRNKR